MMTQYANHSQRRPDKWSPILKTHKTQRGNWLLRVSLSSTHGISTVVHVCPCFHSRIAHNNGNHNKTMKWDSLRKRVGSKLMAQPSSHHGWGQLHRNLRQTLGSHRRASEFLWSHWLPAKYFQNDETLPNVRPLSELWLRGQTRKENRIFLRRTEMWILMVSLVFPSHSY